MSWDSEKKATAAMVCALLVVALALVFGNEWHFRNVRHEGHAIVNGGRYPICLTCEPDRLSAGWKVVKEGEDNAKPRR